MLGRYRIVRGKRPPGEPLPDGKRVDTRKHTQHVLRPDAVLVRALFARPDAAGFERFEAAYLAGLRERYAADRKPFDALAAEAAGTDVYLGCNCPTAKQPDVMRCHTVLALRFMKEKYPKLRVLLPKKP
jgi:hypothetical protein